METYKNIQEASEKKPKSGKTTFQISGNTTLYEIDPKGKITLKDETAEEREERLKIAEFERLAQKLGYVKK